MVMSTSDSSYDVGTNLAIASGFQIRKTIDNNHLVRERVDMDVIVVTLDVFTTAIIDVESPY
jgi:hypothetical protein